MLINIRHHYPDKNGHKPANEEGPTPTHCDNISDLLTFYFPSLIMFVHKRLTKQIDFLNLEHLL